MTTTRTTEPTRVTQGEQIDWTRRFCDYPATEWTLEYRFRSAAGTGLDVEATADGSDHNVVIAADQSDNFTVTGRHRWQAWVTEIADATNTFVVGEGVVDVRAGFVSGTATAVDERSTAKKIVDALEAALLNSASREQLEYEISTPAGTRRVKFMSRKEQTDLLQYYKGIVARELAAERVRNGGRFGKSVLVNVREQ